MTKNQMLALKPGDKVKPTCPCCIGKSAGVVDRHGKDSIGRAIVWVSNGISTYYLPNQIERLDDQEPGIGT